MKLSLLIFISISSSPAYSFEKIEARSCAEDMKVHAAKEIEANKNFIEAIEDQMKKQMLSPGLTTFYGDIVKDSQKRIAENEAFIKDTALIPKHLKCPENTSEPIIHKSDSTGISSLFESNELTCTLTNTYDLRQINKEDRSDYKIIATYSDVEKHIFMGDKQSVSKSYPLDMEKLTNGVVDKIGTLSLEESKTTVAAIMKKMPNPAQEAKIRIQSPKSGFLGFGEEGSWKNGEVSGYSVNTAVSNDDNIGSSGFLTAGNRAKAVLETGPVALIYPGKLGRSVYSDENLPELTIQNTVNFVCVNPKTKVTVNVNDSNRSNIKETNSSDSSESGKTKTSSK